jgi:hypothetical protein
MHSEKMAAEIPVKCDEINDMEESWLSEWIHECMTERKKEEMKWHEMKQSETKRNEPKKWMKGLSERKDESLEEGKNEWNNEWMELTWQEMERNERNEMKWCEVKWNETESNEWT